jgi:hypothetical protein
VFCWNVCFDCDLSSGHKMAVSDETTFDFSILLMFVQNQTLQQICNFTEFSSK